MTTCEVTVLNTGAKFSVNQADIILDGALAQGIALPHQCRGASCGTCKVKVAQGAVDHGWSLGLAISDDEKAQGYCLLCQARALTPTLKIELPVGDDVDAQTPTVFSSEVLSTVNLTPKVKRVVLAAPVDAGFTYPAGAYVEVAIPGVAPNRMYSLAAADENTGILELFVSRHPSGLASGFIHDELKVGDRIQVRGPFGTCRLPQGDGPVVGLAGGTGLAPVLAIFEDALARGVSDAMLLMLSVREVQEIFALDRLETLTRRYQHFRYQIVVTEEVSRYTAEPMLAPLWIQQTFSSMASHRAVISGSPGFVRACVQACMALGLAADRLSTDSFASSGAASGTCTPSHLLGDR
ncbi:2Fe-2S iron-sulfur cluster-binding protein [Pandoraea terrigena]|uniref:2Fe-2S iron-sulfur cluster binding domain protein n=1 Tax=Pandoraea terrigena TaxID=2508292 RepID=A0A5E4WCH6_9BURK|nr:2Fe-2S iron-sulfur cluster binding domain-containing protein [Pandoraea terrigena]VVE20755.1 2Fe-2S iron-sulfur cluster binding domain protein [Pandoraea terrigena]